MLKFQKSSRNFFSKNPCEVSQRRIMECFGFWVKSHPIPTLLYPRLLQVHPTLGYFQGCLKHRSLDKYFHLHLIFAPLGSKAKLSKGSGLVLVQASENSRWMFLPPKQFILFHPAISNSKERQFKHVFQLFKRMPLSI